MTAISSWPASSPISASPDSMKRRELSWSPAGWPFPACDRALIERAPYLMGLLASLYGCVLYEAVCKAGRLTHTRPYNTREYEPTDQDQPLPLRRPRPRRGVRGPRGRAGGADPGHPQRPGRRDPRPAPVRQVVAGLADDAAARVQARAGGPGGSDDHAHQGATRREAGRVHL